jgi:hypothetical protein
MAEKKEEFDFRLSPFRARLPLSRHTVAQNENAPSTVAGLRRCDVQRITENRDLASDSRA